MIDKNPSRMIFNNIKISSNQQINAFDIFLTSNAVILDVRTIHEFARTKIPDAKHLPLEDLNKQINLVKSWDAPIITYCSDGNKSREAAQILKKHHIKAIDGVAKLSLSNFYGKKKSH